MWECPKCGEEIEGSFEVCWNCGTSIDGDEDPGFENADQMAPIVDAPEDTLSVLRPDPVPELFEIDPIADFAEPTAVDLVECYWAKNAFEARFLAQQLVERGIPAVVDGEALSAGLSAVGWGVGYFQPRIRVRSADLDRAKRWLEMYENRRKPEPTE